MSSRTLLPSVALGCLLLGACANAPFQGTADYSQGYNAACAAVGARTAVAMNPAGGTSAALYAGNRDFRAGWDSGLHCDDNSVPSPG